MRNIFLLASLLLLLAAGAFAQQPQTQTAPIFDVNAKYANGVAPGYAPTAGSGLTLNLGAGTVNCASTIDTYAGGTLTMAASNTNYVYLNAASSCVPSSNTTGFTSTMVPIAEVTTSGSAITSIADVRTSFSIGTTTGAGSVTSIATVSPIAGGTITTTGTISLQNSAAANVTSAYGTDTAYFTASGGASTNGDVIKGDANGGIKDSGTLLSSLAPLVSPSFTTPSLGAATASSLLSSGIVDGTAPVTVTTGASCTLGTASGCNATAYDSGYTYNEDATAGAAITYTLPTAAAGKQYCVGNAYNGSAANTGTLELLTSASGQFIIFTDGTLSATGGYVISGGAARDTACVVGVDSTHWILYVYSGTWTKH